MTAPALIGPVGPTPAEYAQMRANRDGWARVIARDFARGFTPDAFTRDTFALLDGAVKTAGLTLKACRSTVWAA